MNVAETNLPSVAVVEDDPTIQLIVKRSLEKRFNVHTYTNGLDALAYLHDGNNVDIIIADLNTPEMGGLELIEQLKASGYFAGIPVLVLSGEESTESRIKCLESGADDYVVKPFNPRELEARINAILRRTGKIMFN